MVSKMPLMTGQHLLPHGVQIRSISQQVVLGAHVLQGIGLGASHGAWQGASHGALIALNDVALNTAATKAKAVKVFIVLSYLLNVFFCVVVLLLVIQNLNGKS